MEADEGTGVTLEVSAEIDGAWSIIKTEEKCELIPTSPSNPKAKVAMSPDTAWKLSSKSWKPDQISALVKISGNQKLDAKILEITRFLD
ncbi:hypothetical protein [Algoriphagus boritolerans]|uniref:SCP-2 sterol transfer family protein n=1 Tax=Algoriphagus boritolerans DSM 17298 = JCM 18970 TaxID=1120964 RepID=A0A1H5X3Y9_9BACT|nr:hypothetical protein [Algoriphagus boritolerans]SEG06468.1 hypothetical protein SAMN03080598_02340 [Algoriphagus boritolerans DSM 17298 = JCM 18970]